MCLDIGLIVLEDDVVGEFVVYDDESLVIEVFMSVEMCEISDNKLFVGILVDIWVILVVCCGEVIVVVERYIN